MNRTLNNVLMGVFLILITLTFIGWNIEADKGGKHNDVVLLVCAAAYFMCGISFFFVVAKRKEDGLKKALVSLISLVC